MKNFLIALLFIFVTWQNKSYAQTSNEIEINKMLNSITDICINEIDDKYDVAIDYSIEILKYKPASLESYYTIYWLSDIEHNNKVSEKLRQLKDEFYSKIEDFNNDQAPKIILFSQYYGNVVVNTEESTLLQQEVIRKLNSIKNNFPNNEYTPLIVILLSLFDKTNEFNHLEYFKNYFPTHSLIPVIDLNIAGSHLQNQNYFNCIDVAEKSMNLYKNVITPYGWPITMDYYNILALCYIEMKDLKKANKYIELIERYAPNYHKLNILKKWAN